MLYALIGCISVILILFLNLSYKDHCIDDLEHRTETLAKLRDDEIMRILLHIQDMTSIRANCTTLDIRKYVNEKIEKLAQKERTR